MHRGNHGGGATPWAHTTRHVERVHLRTISETVTHTTETVYVATSVHQSFTPAHLFSVDERHGARLRMFAS